MNIQPENFIVDTSQYTPIYLVQDTGAIQGGSYVITPKNVEDPKPVTDNLKRFYESSGILENKLANNGVVHSSITKPRILKKQVNNSSTNNVKLANILLPKNNHDQNIAQHSLPIHNVVLKPAVGTVSTVSSFNPAPQVKVDRKIVKLKDFPNALLQTPREKILPKTKPKDEAPVTAPIKHTSVQLLKLGETYHSLNQLSEDQMKMVNQALKIFTNPEQTKREPQYDPVTNTRFIYKVVSPRDLTVVGRNKFVVKKKNGEASTSDDSLVADNKKESVIEDIIRSKDQVILESRKSEYSNSTEENIIWNNIKEDNQNDKRKDNLINELFITDDMMKDNNMKKDNLKNLLKRDKKKSYIKKVAYKKERFKKDTNKRDDYKKEEDFRKEEHSKDALLTVDGEIKRDKDTKSDLNLEELFGEVTTEQTNEVKVTRSGRQVKLPKQILPDEIPKPKKKVSGVVSCFQCSAEFCSFYRLQKHYENQPTHIPAKVHSNLFHCLLAIIKSGSEEDRTNIFIQQLEQLIQKLKTLLPCLMKKIDGEEGKSCTINDDVGRLFGMNPGKYNLNVDALNCVKDKDGNCRHNPPSKCTQLTDAVSATPIWHPVPNEEASLKSDNEDCARINAVDKWPTANKRIWNSKQQKTIEMNAKRMKIDIDLDNLVNFSPMNNEHSAINEGSISLLDNLDLDVGDECPIQPNLVNGNPNNNLIGKEIKKTVSGHTQFHSTHFDIRSSPMKPSSAVFSKFQINTDKLPKYDVQVIQPLEIEKPCELVTETAISPNPDSCDFQSIFRDGMINLSPCKNTSVIPDDLTFDTSKEWIMDAVNDKSNESFMKTNGVIEPSLLHVQESSVDKLVLSNLVDSNDQIEDCDSRLLSSQNSSVLNFLESLGNECLTYPETEIRNNAVENVDFQLDLFSLDT